MITYLILILWLISPVLLLFVADAPSECPFCQTRRRHLGMDRVLESLLPAFAPYSDPGKVGLTTYLGFLGVCLLLSALLLGLATLRIRGVALKQAGQPSGRRSPTPVLPPFSDDFHGGRRFPVPRSTVTRSCGASGTDRSRRGCLRVVWMLYAALGVLWLCSRSRSCVGYARQSGNDRDHEHVSGFAGIIAPERECRHQPGRGAGARQPRRTALHAALDPFDPGREVVGIVSADCHILIWPADLWPESSWRDSGHWISYLLLLGLILGVLRGDHQPGACHWLPGSADWDVRSLLCVSAYVVFSIGWVVLFSLAACSTEPLLLVWEGPVRQRLRHVASRRKEFFTQHAARTASVFSSGS